MLETLHLHTSAATLSPTEATAHATLVGMLHSAGVDHEQLAHKLLSEYVASVRDIRLALRDGPELLGSIGIKPG